MSINTKELKIKEGLIDFSNDKITFFSVNNEKGIIDIYLEIDGKRNSSNKFQIILKDYKIIEEGNEFEFNINENTKVKVKMIIKNKFFNLSDTFNIKSKMRIFNQNKSEKETQIQDNKPISTSINIKDRLKMFNQANSIINQKSRESSLINTNIPKKINNQFLNQFEKNIKNDNGNNQNISNNINNKFQNKNIKIEINKKQEFDKNIKKEEVIVENVINNEEENKKEIIENEINKVEENKEEIIENEINKEGENKEEIIENEINKEEENKEEIIEKEMNKDEEISKIRESFDSISTSSTPNQKKSPFLDSITLEKYLENPIQNRETFCEGFFISSFSKDKGKVIERSQIYKSYCNHEECSKLPAMKPEIIFRYPLKDTKNLELNNLAATICFPTGIKVCYNEEDPLINENYMAPITNQLGERYYMMTYHFYIKKYNPDYIKEYFMHPLKHHLMKFADPYLDNQNINDKILQEIEKNLEFCQDLGFREFVYIPHCLSIISKYPYINQMQKCLESIFKILSDNNESLINEIIMYLIESIPIPKQETRLKFYIPYFPTPIEINSPKYKDLSLLNNNYSLLFQLFSIDNILVIFRLMLFEKKILFIDKSYDTISKVTDSFISLLYPFQWVNTFIPIMSDQMIKYLQSFLPFINGTHRSLLYKIKETLLEIEDTIQNDEFFVIFIDNKTIQLSSNIINKKGDYLKYLDKYTPKLPTVYEKELKKELIKIKEDIETSEKNNRTSSNFSSNSNYNYFSIYDLQIKNAFLHFFVEILFDYTNYIIQVDDQVIFNINLLLENRPKKDHEFYKEFSETQIFQNFTQNIVKEDYSYFNQQIRKKDEKDKLIPSNFNGENVYIKPHFMKFEEIDFNLIEKEFEKYSNNENLEMSKKIIKKDIEIKNENYNVKECRVYKFPENRLEKKLTLDFTPKIIQKFQETKKKKSHENKVKEDEEKMKEDIKDFMINIFNSNSELKNENNKKIEICNVLNSSFGRHYFIELLYQNHTDIKLMIEEYFYLLDFFIFNAIIGFLKEAETDNILEDIILILKASKYYGHLEKKKVITIFDKLIPKLYSYAKIVQINFWTKWFEIELFEKKNKEDIDEEYIKKVLFDIIDYMFLFKLEKDFIKKVGEELIKEYFKETSENFCILKDELLNILSSKKY